MKCCVTFLVIFLFNYEVLCDYSSYVLVLI